MNYDSFEVHCPHCGKWSSPDTYAMDIDLDDRVPKTVPVRVVMQCTICKKVIGANWAMVPADWRVVDG